MAESSTSQSSSFEHLAADATPIPPSLKFVMANLKSIVSTTLKAENYPLWSSQVLKLFKANGFDGFLTGTSPCPPQFLQSDAGITNPNPRYQQWLLLDQNLSATLTATISISVLPYVLNLSSTAEVWQTLLKRLQATNRSRVIQLKTELNRVSLKNNSMIHFLSEIKSLVDQITAAGSHIDSEDVILHILNGLPSSYQAFKVAIRTRAGSTSTTFTLC